MLMSESQIRRWLTAAAAAFALALVGEVASQRALFADGVNFLLQIVSHNDFSHWDYPRQFVHYISQFPAVLAMGMGVHDLTALSSLYGLGLFGVYLATLGACAWLTPADQRGYLLFVVVALAYTSLNSSLFIISESHWAAGLFFAQFYFLMFIDANTARAKQALAIAAAVASLRAYESFAVLGPTLTALAAYRVWQGRGSKRSPTTLASAVLGISGVASACIGLYYMFFSERTVQKVGLGTIAHDLVHDPNFVLSSLLVWLFAFYIVVPRAGRRAHRYTALATLGAMPIGIALGLLPLNDPTYLPTRLHYPARVLNIALPLLFAALMVALQRRGRLRVTPYVTVPLCLLLTWSTTWQLATSWQWRAYTTDVVESVQQSPGPLLPLTSSQVSGSPFNWSWTLPTLSIVAAGMQTGYVPALLVDDPHPAFQPFDPTLRSQWPDLTAFGVTYRSSPAPTGP